MREALRHRHGLAVGQPQHCGYDCTAAVANGPLQKFSIGSDRGVPQVEGGGGEPRPWLVTPRAELLREIVGSLARRARQRGVGSTVQALGPLRDARPLRRVSEAGAESALGEFECGATGVWEGTTLARLPPARPRPPTRLSRTHGITTASRGVSRPRHRAQLGPSRTLPRATAGRPRDGSPLDAPVGERLGTPVAAVTPRRSAAGPHHHPSRISAHSCAVSDSGCRPRNRPPCDVEDHPSRTSQCGASAASA